MGFTRVQPVGLKPRRNSISSISSPQESLFERGRHEMLYHTLAMYACVRTCACISVCTSVCVFVCVAER